MTKEIELSEVVRIEGYEFYRFSIRIEGYTYQARGLYTLFEISDRLGLTIGEIEAKIVNKEYTTTH